MLHLLIGTRAQLIKMLPVMRVLAERGLDYNFVFIAQHRATIYEMLDDFSLRHPDHVLGDTGTDIVSSGRMLRWSFGVLWSGWRRRAEIFEGDRDGVAVVHGDAPPLLLGALIARFQGLRVAQVEAGLRSFDLLRPFPEEAVRVGAGRLGLIDLHFCQDDAALRNAQAYPGRQVLVEGNTIVDALRMVRQDAGAAGGAYGLVSLHRYELLRDRERLHWVADRLRRISARHPLRFVLHPPTERALRREGLLDELGAVAEIELLPRLTFLEFQKQMAGAAFLISDGGSNQEESAYLGLPCLLFRERTERGEGLGANVVLSRFDDAVIDAFVANPQAHRVAAAAPAQSPSEQIVDELERFLAER